MSRKPCASCHQILPSDQLVTLCSCGREVCIQCLIPMYEEDAAGPNDVAGYICQACADQLVAMGGAQAGPAPTWAM